MKFSPWVYRGVCVCLCRFIIDYQPYENPATPTDVGASSTARNAVQNAAGGI
jgi:hypothetical protein